DHCAVSSQHEHQIDGLGQRIFLNRFDDTSGFVFDAFTLNLRPAYQFDVVLAQPFSQTAEGLKRVRLMRLDDYAYAFDRRLDHWLELSAVNARMISARCFECQRRDHRLRGYAAAHCGLALPDRSSP